MTFARTQDLALVRDLIAAPGSWDAATDDSAPAAADYEPNGHPAIWYVVATRPTNCVAFQEIVGLYTLIPQNAVCFEIHASRVFGRAAAEASRAIFAWAFENTPARRIVASIPRTNRAAIRAAERAGMTRCGVNARSFLKRGQLVDQILLGISPEDFSQERGSNCLQS